MTKTRVVGIIPSRYGSTRLPGKPLAMIKGKTLIERVYGQVSKCRNLDDVIIATDDTRIRDAVKKIGARAVMTSAECKSGTDRLAEVAKSVEKSADILINIQGDEPLISPVLIDKLAADLKRNPDIDMITAACGLNDRKDIDNPNAVKVVLDKDNYAIYFSRYPIPYNRNKGKVKYFKHLGIYGFRRKFLLKYSVLKQTPLESAEQLEQLRALENGYKIKVVITDKDSIGVDTLEDIKKVERILNG